MKDNNYYSIPTGIINKTEQEICREAEAYFLDLKEKYIAREGARKRFLSRLDKWWDEDNRIGKLDSILADNDFKMLTGFDYDLLMFGVMGEIAIAEYQSGLPVTLDRLSDLEEVNGYMQRVIMGIRRLEFGWGKDFLVLFWQLLEKTKPSYLFLGEMTDQHIIGDKVDVTVAFAKLYYEHGDKNQAWKLLTYMNKKLPDSIKKIMLFSDTYLVMGDGKSAFELLDRHPEPSKEIVELRNILREGMKTDE